MQHFIIKKHIIPVPVLVFICTEALIYTTYLFLDFIFLHTLKISDIFKYLGIFICFIYTLLSVCHVPHDSRLSLGGIDQNAAGLFGKKRHLCLLACTFLVLFSDYCLLFTHHYLCGVIIFGLVQYLYFAAMAGLSKLPCFLIFCAGIALPASLFFHVICGLTGYLVYAASIYMSMLAINIAYASYQFCKSRNIYTLLFALGMILYSLCDLNVGLKNLPAFFSSQTPHLLHIFAAPYFQEITTYAMWLFYLPAQVLIALSIPIKKGSFLLNRKSRPDAVKAAA